MNHRVTNVIYKVLFKMIFFMIIMFAIGIIEPSVTPMIDNDVALTQMELSDAYFVALTTYQKLKPLFNIAKLVVSFVFLCLISSDIFKLYRNLTNPDPEET